MFKFYNRKKILLFIVVFVVFINTFDVGAQINVQFDLENLRSQNEAFITAYDIIKIRETWEKIREINLPLSNIAIGIIDTGIDKLHQEFNNPNVNIDAPVSALFDSKIGGHGTQIAGIIGANNVLGNGGTLLPDSPQMNGILSGVLKEDKYKLIIENFSLATSTQAIGIFASLENVLKKNPAIINMSIALERCSDLSFVMRNFIVEKCAKTDQEFSDLEKIDSFFKKYPQITFWGKGEIYGIYLQLQANKIIILYKAADAVKILNDIKNKIGGSIDALEVKDSYGQIEKIPILYLDDSQRNAEDTKYITSLGIQFSNDYTIEDIKKILANYSEIDIEKTIIRQRFNWVTIKVPKEKERYWASKLEKDSEVESTTVNAIMNLY